MLSTLKQLLQLPDAPGEQLTLSHDQINLACAALLVEVAVIDGHFDGTELASLKSTLRSQFSVAEAQISELIDSAKKEQHNASSVYQFTRIVNDHCSYQDKCRLVGAMWHIAYADGDLDKYEEYIIRKVSDLLHLSHGDFIKAKIDARPSSD